MLTSGKSKQSGDIHLTGDRSPFEQFHLIAACATGLCAVLLLFVVPLFVPMAPVRTVSASYIAGFNNSFAIGAAVALSLAVLLVSLRRQRSQDSVQPVWGEARLPTRFTATVVLVSAAILAISGWLVAASHLRYLGDAGYIIEQATVRSDTGRALYRQLEFAYGPMLLLPEVWLSKALHCSVTAAYFVLLVLEQSLGLVMLAYVLNELPMRASLRRPALVLLAVGTLTPHLGLNYTLFRFVSPFAALLFASRGRSPWPCAFLLSLGELLVLLISPELGLAMAVGVLSFGLVRTWQQGWRWLTVAIVPLLVLGAILATFGRPYMKMTALISRGALNLPVGPYPHTLVLLFALVWLVPAGLGRMLHFGESASARILAFYVTSLAFMSAALGRCDPLHVLFNGIGLLLLSVVAISHSSHRVRVAWLGCIAVLVFWNHRVNDGIFRTRIKEVIREAALHHLPPTLLDGAAQRLVAWHHSGLAVALKETSAQNDHLDMYALDQMVGSAPVATPMEIPPSIEEDLKSTHQYSPGYYAFWVDILNPAAERRSIDEVNDHTWMLLPSAWNGSGGEFHTPSHIGLFQGMRMPYRQRKPIPYFPGLAFKTNLGQNWIAVRQFGLYTLYRHRGTNMPEQVSLR